MPFDARSAILTGELDGSIEEGRTDTSLSMGTADGEAGHPPRPGIVRQDPGQRSVVDDPRKARSRSNSGPANRLAVNVRQKARRNRSVCNFISQCLAMVTIRLRITHEQATPAPRGIVTSPSKRLDHITPPLRSG